MERVLTKDKTPAYHGANMLIEDDVLSSSSILSHEWRCLKGLVEVMYRFGLV